MLSGVNGFPSAPDSDIGRIVHAYHAWRGEAEAGPYMDIPGFCTSATLDDIRKHNHVLSPGRYVLAPDAELDDEPFESKLDRLAFELREHFATAQALQTRIETALSRLQQ